mgnify:CR=1 FL=1
MKTKTKNKRTSQEEVLAELFAEAELQGSVRKKKNWDAWLDQEEEQQSEKELQVYLEEYSDPTLYLTPKEVKAWNRMPKSKQKRLLEKESRQVLQAWKVGERKGSAGGGRKADSMEELVFLQGRGTQRGTRSGTPLHGIWKPEKGSTKASGRRDQPLPTIPRDTVPRVPDRHIQKPENKRLQECRVRHLLLRVAHPRLLQLHWPPELQRKQHKPLKTMSRK